MHYQYLIIDMKRNRSNKKKVHVTDTVKGLAKNPKRAMKRDYEQTKADMENIKDKATEDK